MADDPSFDSVKVPDRTEATAKAIDNVGVADELGNTVRRQVVVTGDPVDHSLVGAHVNKSPDDAAAGPVTWPAGTHGESGRATGRTADEETRDLLHAIAKDAAAIRGMLARFFEDYGDDDEAEGEGAH